jgi:dynein intermediate chain 2
MHFLNSEQDHLAKTKNIYLEISKKRCQLNRQTSFSDQPATMLEEVMPNKELEKEYIRSVAVSRGVQAAQQKNMSEINTARTEVVSQGMSHTEGGWPKDINCADPEQTSRYRKKFEKD